MGELDLTLAYFLATRDPAKVRRERPIESVRSILTRDYDRDTERSLLLIRAQGKTNQNGTS